VAQNPHPPNPNELETVALLRLALRRFIAASDEVTAAYELTSRQYDLLAILHRPQAPAPMTPTVVARELCLSPSAATELLTRAVAAGIVTREPDSANARRKQIAPTPEGTRRFFGAVAALRGERERLAQGLLAPGI
jgi:DNA-binding MarR family transcriptional regulator